jgi:hypothetical protein
VVRARGSRFLDKIQDNILELRTGGLSKLEKAIQGISIHWS